MKFRLRSRRGAFVVLTAILTVSMMAMVALAVDFSRMGSLRNELQVSADASALGGAVQMLPGHTFPTPNPCAAGCPVYDSAAVYATRNTAMQGVVTVDSVTFGRWDDVARTFTPAATPFNALRTVVSRQATGLTMTGLSGVAAPRIKARATAWAEAPVISNGCIKPWSLPYPLLMQRVNTYQGIQNTSANLTRPFTTADLNALIAMPASAREFDLKNGSGPINDPFVDSLSISGNYQSVQLGKLWDVRTGTYPTPGPVSGGNSYRDNIAGVTCYGINLGDSLITQQGNMVGPTLQGMQQSAQQPNAPCVSIVNNRRSPTNGDCMNAQGTVGATGIATFYLCSTGCGGSSKVSIPMIAAFQIDKVYPNSQNGVGGWDMAQIKGSFKALSASGRVGSGGAVSSVLTVVLVK